jgi:hypothetical protein
MEKGRHNDAEWQWVSDYYYMSWDELEAGTPREVDVEEVSSVGASCSACRFLSSTLLVAF